MPEKKKFRHRLDTPFEQSKKERGKTGEENVTDKQYEKGPRLASCLM